MSIEYVDRRGSNKVIDSPAEQRLEADEGEKPTVLEIVKDREKRYSEALMSGDVEKMKAVDDECAHPAKTYGDVVPFKKQVRGEKLSWKSVGYVVAFLPMGSAQVLMVRAVGMRTDERVFTADYALPPMLEEGQDFVGEAKKRLDTFLGCSCYEGGRCKFHGETCPGQAGPGKWLEEDIKRLQKIQSGSLPEAVEVLMKAEAARAQNRIVTPGRG